MSPDPLDVVVVTYESAAHLARCLGELPSWARPVVVDNGSRDGSAQIAREFGAGVVINDENRGYTAAANQGARLGRAECLLFLNPDACIDAQSLALLRAALLADDDVVAVSPQLVGDDGSVKRVHWPFPSPWATWLEALGAQRGAGASDGFVVGTCLLVRRPAFEALGGFDERFWLYGEEADLARRALACGWRVAEVRGAAARHVGGASAPAAHRLAFEHFQRGAEHFIAKHHGPVALVAHRTGLLVGSALRVPLLTLRDAERAAYRRSVAGRLLRVLLTAPGKVGA